MNWLMEVAVAGFLLSYLSKSARSIPKMHIGINDVFGRRINRVSQEGLHFAPWGIIATTLYSIENNIRPVTLEVKTLDGVTVILKGAFEYKPDTDDLLTFMNNEKGLRAGAVDNSIMKELGFIAGIKKGRDFIKFREAIDTLINCLLRLGKMPHEDPRAIGLRMKPVLPDKRLDFYKKHAPAIRRLLAESKEKSPIEKQYGITITEFDLTTPAFDQAFNQAIQKEQETAAQAKASERELALAGKYGNLTQAQINAAQVSLGKAVRQVHSFEGTPIKVSIGGANQ